MSTDTTSTMQGNMSSTESIACGQTGHLRALDMLLCPTSPTSEFSDTESQFNSTNCRDRYPQDEIEVSPTQNIQPSFAPSDLEESDYSSFWGDDKENRPPTGLVFRVTVSDTCHRVEASGTVENGQGKQVEMELDLPLCKPVRITISISQSSPSDSSRHTRKCERRDHGGIYGGRIHKIRRSKQPAVEEC
ncbi:hypothetical protein HRG_013358 [Hirsutella rhossiliensis]